MTNRLLTITLVLAVTVALLAEAGRSVMTPEGRWQRWMQTLAAQQIADTLGRQVRVGPVAEVSLAAVEVEDLAVAEGATLAEGAVVRADRVRVAFDLVGIARGEVAPAAGINRVEVQGAWLHAVRGPDGELNVQQMLPEPTEPPAPPEERFRGVVTVSDATVVYEDYAVPTTRGQPLVVELAQIEGRVDMRRPGWIAVSASATERLGRAGLIELEAETESETGFVWAQAHARDIDAAWWANTLATIPEVRLERARADVDASFGLLPSGDGPPDTSLSGEVRVREVAARVRRLGGRRVLADASATITMDGARIHRLSARTGSVRLDASGFVGNFDDPTVDADFDVQVRRPRELAELVPPEVTLPEQVGAAEVDGPLMVSGRLSGPLAQANLSAAVSLPGQVRYADARVGEVAVGPIDLRVDVLDLSEPNVRARAGIAEVVPEDTAPLEEMLAGQVEGPLTIAPLTDVRADVLWSREMAVAHTTVAVPRLAAGEVAVENLRADVAMVGNALLVSDLYAEPVGATLVADGVVGLSREGGPWAWMRGEISELDLARVPEIEALEAVEGVGGTMSARFVGRYEDGEPLAVARAAFDRPGYREYSAESLTGLVIADADAVQVRGASFRDPLGAGWVRGVLPLEGEMAADFGVAGVDLAALNERFEVGVERLRGEAFVTGSLSGTPQEPRVEADLQVFGPGAGEYQADAVAASVAGGLEEIELREMYASAGRIVVRATGTVSELDLEAGDGRIDGTVSVGGPVDRTALELAKLQGQDLSGALHADLSVGGTLKRPSARGEVRVDFARYETLATDDAVATVSLQGDVLQMESLEVPLGEALIVGEATVTSLYDDPLVAVNARAENVILQDLAAWQEFDLPLSGRVDLEHFSLSGSLTDLQQNMRGVAQVTGSDLELGTEPIGGVSAIVVFDEDAIMLQRTTVALAGGTLALGGQFHVKQRRIAPSTVELDGVSIARLLRAAVPVVRRFGDVPAEERAEGQRALSQQLLAWSMRMSGIIDGSVNVAGLLPEAPDAQRAGDAGGQERIEELLRALSGEARVAVSEPAIDGRSLPDLEVTTSVADEPEVAFALTGAEGDALITADGRWRPGGQIDALAEVSALDLARLRPWLPEQVRSTGGNLNLYLQVTGSVQEPRLRASVDILEPEAHGARFDLISAPVISYDGSSVNIDSLVIRAGDEELFVDGSIPFDWETRSVPPDAELEVVARAESTDLGIFPPIIADAMAPAGGEVGPLGEVEANGTLDAVVRVSGSPHRPVLNGEVQIDAPSIGTPWLSSPIEDVVLKTSFTGQEGTTVVELAELSARAEATTLEAGGEARFAPSGPEQEGSPFSLAELHRNTFDFTAGISAPRQTLGGGLTARKLRGTVTLATEEPGRQVLTIAELGANLGDGSVLVDGSVAFTSFLPEDLVRQDFDVVIEADEARPRYSSLFLGTIDGRIVARNPEPGEPVEVTGGLTVSHAVLGLPGGGGEAGGTLRGMPASFPSPEFKLRLAIGPDVRVKTIGMSAPLEPTDQAVLVSGTPQRPTVQAMVEVQEGEAQMPGGVLDIETAGVRFLLAPQLGTATREPPVELYTDGRIWASVTRRIESAVIDGRQVGPVDVLLEVSGTVPGEIRVQAQSTPPMAEEQIYALLGTAPFTGGAEMARAGDLQDAMTKQFVTALGAAFRAYVFQPFQEELKQLLGLSVLEVNFAFDQPVSVRMGGYVVEDLLVTYRTSFTGGEEEYDLSVSYTVERKFEVSYRADEAGDNRMFLQYVHRF